MTVTSTNASRNPFFGNQWRRQQQRQRRLYPSVPLHGIFVVLVLVFGLGSIVTFSWWTAVMVHPPTKTTPALAFQKKRQEEKPKTVTVPTTVAVFYHIYIPTNKGRKGLQRTQQILHEQLQQVAQAAATWQLQQSQALVNTTTTTTKNKSKLSAWTVYYTTTGASSVEDVSSHTNTMVVHEWLEQTVCAPYAPYLRCVANGPHESIGNEDLTLQALLQYCRRSTTPTTTTTTKSQNQLVIYLHSKGTYHSAGGRNDVWRRALTQAATHSTCLNAIQPPPQKRRTRRRRSSNPSNVSHRRPPCNVCGLQFYPLWTTLFPGNMFAAHCDYVQQLKDPRTEFPIQLERVVEWVRHHSSTAAASLWTHDLYNFSNPSIVGLDRYAAEHWIASHPDIRPCDVVLLNNHNNPPPIIHSKTTTTTTLFVEQNWTDLQRQWKWNNDFDHRSQQWWWWRFLFPSAWFSGWGRNRDSYEMDDYHPATTATIIPIKAEPAPRVSIYNGDWFRLNQTLLRQIIGRRTSSEDTNPNELGGSEMMMTMMFPNTTSQLNNNNRTSAHNNTRATLEYFLLPGLLFRHSQIYQKFPPRDSWIWQWYPRGQVWLDALLLSTTSSSDNNVTATEKAKLS